MGSRGKGNPRPTFYSTEEQYWYETHSKRVIYQCARQFAALAAGECDNLQLGFTQVKTEAKRQG